MNRVDVYMQKVDLLMELDGGQSIGWVDGAELRMAFPAQPHWVAHGTRRPAAPDIGVVVLLVE